MTKGDLDGVNIWGRPLKPVALGASVLMLTLTIFNITDKGVFADLALGDAVAVLSGASFLMLVGGWFGRIQRLAEYGLLLGCVVYVLRASFLFFVEGPATEGIYLSIGAAIIVGGAYLLEKWDNHGTNRPIKFRSDEYA